MDIIRKVDLNMNEEYKYEIIKKLVETNGNKKTAALRIGCTVRHVNRMIKGYNSEGKGFFSHGNKSNQPFHAIHESTKTMIIDLYKTKYYGANFTHYSELLATKEHISVAPNTIRNILIAEYILSPKARRATKKMVKEKLLIKQETSCISDDAKLEIEKNIIAIEDAHPHRPRCAYSG